MASAAGPAVMVVSGAMVSTVKVRAGGSGSTLPAWSVPRTSNRYSPSSRSGRACGDSQADQVDETGSRRHSKSTPGDSEANSNTGEAAAVGPLGPDPIVVTFAWVSTVNSRLTAVVSTLPEGSIALTWKRWAPSAWAGAT